MTAFRGADGNTIHPITPSRASGEIIQWRICFQISTITFAAFSGSQRKKRFAKSALLVFQSCTYPVSNANALAMNKTTSRASAVLTVPTVIRATQNPNRRGLTYCCWQSCYYNCLNGKISRLRDRVAKQFNISANNRSCPSLALRRLLCRACCCGSAT